MLPMSPMTKLETLPNAPSRSTSSTASARPWTHLWVASNPARTGVQVAVSRCAGSSARMDSGSPRRCPSSTFVELKDSGGPTPMLTTPPLHLFTRPVLKHPQPRRSSRSSWTTSRTCSATTLARESSRPGSLMLSRSSTRSGASPLATSFQKRSARTLASTSSATSDRRLLAAPVTMSILSATRLSG